MDRYDPHDVMRIVERHAAGAALTDDELARLLPSPYRAIADRRVAGEQPTRDEIARMLPHALAEALRADRTEI